MISSIQIHRSCRFTRTVLKCSFAHVFDNTDDHGNSQISVDEQQHMENDNITVLVDGNKMQVPAKFVEVSDYMHGLLSLGFSSDEEIEILRVSPQTLKQVIQFYQLNNFAEVTPKTPINGSDLQNFVDKKNADFIQRHPLKSLQFQNLYKGAEFLGCHNLLKLCASRFACYLYFEDSKQAFLAKKQQLGIEIKVEFEVNQKFKRLYPFLNKKVKH